MKESNALQHILQEHIGWHKARRDLFACFILALLKMRTVNLTQVALALNPKALAASNYRRIQRFLADFTIDFRLIARLMLALTPQKTDFIVTIDRTNWQFGTTPINIFMVGIAYRGLSFPIIWKLLGKKGISSSEERIELMRRFLGIVSPDLVRAVVADREFIGHRWLAFLEKQGLPFVVRIRQNTLIGSARRANPAHVIFRSLPVGYSQVLRGKRYVYGLRLFVIAARLHDELLIVLTPDQPRKALRLYAQRWQIETLFGALKSRGFNVEQTHLTARNRIEKLLAIMAISFAWAYLVGDWLDRQVRPIPVKSHGRRAQSVFRYGLDHLRCVLLNIEAMLEEFFICLKVLSCT
jgi:hypothetical protein